MKDAIELFKRHNIEAEKINFFYKANYNGKDFYIIPNATAYNNCYQVKTKEKVLANKCKLTTAITLIKNYKQ